MRQKRTIRASSVSAKRGVWLGWAIFCSFARGDYDGPFLPRSQSTQHTSRETRAQRKRRGGQEREIRALCEAQSLFHSLRRGRSLIGTHRLHRWIRERQQG